MKSTTEYIIATHSGVFHADDVFTIAARKYSIPRAKIIRTRDENDLRRANEIYDVGGEYSPADNRFDHHHFNGDPPPPVWQDSNIPLSSFGMMWLHYGHETIYNILWNADRNPEQIDFIYDRVRTSLVQTIDSIDNGIKVTNSKIVTICHIISQYNPNWDENQSFDNGFEEAVDLAQNILMKMIKKFNSEYKAYSIVEKSIEQCGEDPFIILNRPVPWQKALFEIEDRLDMINYFKFVIYKSPEENWMVQSIPSQYNYMEKRILFPENWAGKRYDELEKTSEIPNAVFCHSGRFISGWQTLDSAKMAAKEALYNVSN